MEINSFPSTPSVLLHPTYSSIISPHARHLQLLFKLFFYIIIITYIYTLILFCYFSWMLEAAPVLRVAAVMLATGNGQWSWD